MVVIKSLLLAALASVGLAGEGYHLVNCGAQGASTAYSVVVRCGDDSNCNFNPADGNFCTKKQNGYQTWESAYSESTNSCNLGNGGRFHWSIASNGGSFPPYTPAGDGWTNSKGYKIYRDDAHPMYYDQFGQACRSIYYAI